MNTLTLVQWVLLVPVLGGSIFSLLCLIATLRYQRSAATRITPSMVNWPPVTIFKPVYGLEKHLRENLRSACLQDYPIYQVVFCVQTPLEPALPLLYELQEEFGTDRVTVAVEQVRVGPNGKINNLLGGLAHARHDMFVISDTDVRLSPGYLKRIIAPLTAPDVGCVCTPYRAISADTWVEKLELLTFNSDFVPSIIFAQQTGASLFCLGASVAFTRKTLEQIGGLSSLADYLVEDYEIGRRIAASGKKILLVNPVVDITVDLPTLKHWWTHQVYWDQNTRAARPGGFFCTVLTRAIPFALFFAIARLADPLGLTVLACAIALRIAAAAGVMHWVLADREGLRALVLLPVRDLACLVSWLLAMTKRTTSWRGSEFLLTQDGRLVPQDTVTCEPSSSPETISASLSR